MKKYEIPIIKVSQFSSEKIVAESMIPREEEHIELRLFDVTNIEYASRILEWK